MTTFHLVSFGDSCERQLIAENDIPVPNELGAKMNTMLQESLVEKANVELKELKSDEFTWSYYETKDHDDDSECIVMVHGFSSNKDTWTAFVHALQQGRQKKYHIVIPDMPGHGATEPRDLTLSYDYLTTSERLNNFVNGVVGSDTKFHLMGLSMGGGITGNYAASYSDDLLSATVWCPHSLKTAEVSDYTTQRENGDNILLDCSYSRGPARMKMIFHNVPEIPPPLLQHMAYERYLRQDILEKIFSDIDDQSGILNDRADKITCPFAVMWGENDRLLHVSGIEEFEKMKPLPFVHRFEDCGHVIHMEKLDESIEYYSKFLGTL